MAYFAASCDTLEQNTKFAKSLDLDYPILSDESCAVARAYGVSTADRVWPKRWTFYIGADGKVLFVDQKVSPRSAGADTAAKLAELGVAKQESTR